MVVFLAHTSIASLTNDCTSMAAKIIVSIHKGQRICFPAVINSRKAERRVLSVSRNALEVAVKWLDRLHSCTALLKVCHHFLPLLHYK